MASGQGEPSGDCDSTAWRRFFGFWTTLPGVLSGIAALLAASGALLTETPLFGGGRNPSALPTTTGQAVACPLRITAPKDGKRVSNRGTVIEGTACSNADVWIFHYPGNGDYYRKNAKPLAVVGGRWIQPEERIGALDDPVGTRYRIVALGTGRACSRALEAILPNKHNGVRLRQLPAGCPPWKSATNAQSVVVVKKKE